MPISGCKNTKKITRLADVSKGVKRNILRIEKKRIFAALFIQFQL